MTVGQNEKLLKNPQTAPDAPALKATERAYAAVLGWIEGRQIGPGTVLDERRLSEALSVSRTPLRNVLSRLQGEGYLVRMANGAMVVRDIGVGEVLELLFVRRLLEPEAAILAIGRIPPQRLQELRRQLASPELPADSGLQTWQAGDDVHDIITEYCGNRSLASIIEDARRRIRVSNIERVPGRGGHAHAEHLAIIEALAAGDRQAVHQAVLKHLDNIRQGFLAAFGVPHDDAR